MAATQGSVRQQVELRKKVRLAEDLTSDEDRPTKKVRSTQVFIYQTIEGRVGKSYGGATISSKDKRVRQSQVSRAITVGESEDESEESDERPQRGWKYHGLSRWTQAQDGEQEGTANANPGSSSARSYTITVRHTDGTDHDFFVWGNALQETSRFFRAARSGRWTSADTPTIVEEDVNLFEKSLLAVHDWEEFERDTNKAIAASKPHPTDGDEVSSEKCRKREEMFETLIGVYILADKYEALAGANRVIDEIIRFSHESNLLPHLEAVDQAYESSLEGSRLRMLFRDIYVHESSCSSLEALVRNDVHPDFTADVVLEYCRLRRDHPNGHINKWFNQAVSDRPKGYYHQELSEPTPEERGIELEGDFIEMPRVVKLTKPADKGSLSGEEISKASTALLEAIGE